MCDGILSQQGRHVFYTAEEVEYYGGQEYIFDDEVYEIYSQDLLELVFKMVDPDVSERPSANDLIDS